MMSSAWSGKWPFLERKGPGCTEGSAILEVHGREISFLSRVWELLAIPERELL